MRYIIVADQDRVAAQKAVNSYTNARRAAIATVRVNTAGDVVLIATRAAYAGGIGVDSIDERRWQLLRILHARYHQSDI